MNYSEDYSHYSDLCLDSGDDYEPYGYAEIEDSGYEDYAYESDYAGSDEMDDLNFY